MIAEIIGRFHPLLVHLPIGILILAFVMELASKLNRYKDIKVAIPFILKVAILTSILALFSGWIMPKEGAFDESLIGWHFWTAVGMTISTLVLLLLNYTKNAQAQNLYFPLFVVTMILLTLTGHFGGSLTHGKDHLVKAIDSKSKNKVQDVNVLNLYSDIIQPILQKKCASCHNEGKQKGELVMTNSIDLMKGGVNGPIIVKGDVLNSSLIQRVHLPLEDDEHMPPDGKVQLSQNEIKLLEWWIENDANFETKVGALEQSDEIANILKGYEQGQSTLDTSSVNLISSNTLTQLAAKNISVVPESEESPFAYVSFQRDTSLTSGKLRSIKNIAGNITELDLSFTNMDDGLMSQLSRFENLQKLKLQNSQISTHGLKHLSDLKHLSNLNLYGTKVDDQVFEVLKKMNALSKVYLWQTNITEDGLLKFLNERPLISVVHKIDDSIFGDARLKAPIISASKEIFQESLEVNLSRNFKGVEVYYTLDETKPDSTSLRYDSTFVITETTSVKAISVKTGWLNSETSEKLFMKAGHVIASANLERPPSSKYAAKGAESLIDLEKGSKVFSDGKWLGFEGEHMTAVLDLGSKELVNKVAVGCLEDTGSYIFFPRSIEVLSSMDGLSYTSQQKITIPMASEPMPGHVKSFLLDFDQVSTRYLKIIVQGTLKNPDWHAAPGSKNWIFIDEVLVN